MGYKKIGSFITPITEKNIDGLYSEVLGVAIDKVFMPSVANTIGTDLKKYYVLRKNRFAFNPMHVGRDERLPIAIYECEAPALVSPAYQVFEVSDDSVNLDYLMLLFKTDEFDHICWFHTDASVRGGLTWEDFCDIEVDIPDIIKQNKIVKQYQTIEAYKSTLVLLNEKMIEAGITDISINVLKNSKFITINEYCKKISSGGTPNREHGEYYGGNINWLKSGEVHNNITVGTEETITDLGLKNSSAKMFPVNTVLMAMYGVTAGEVGFLDIEATTNQAICGMICNNFEEAAYLYFYLLKKQAEIKRLSNGGAQNNLNQDIIKNTLIPLPDDFSKLHTHMFLTQMKYYYQILNRITKVQNYLIASVI